MSDSRTTLSIYDQELDRLGGEDIRRLNDWVVAQGETISLHDSPTRAATMYSGPSSVINELHTMVRGMLDGVTIADGRESAPLHQPPDPTIVRRSVKVAVGVLDVQGR